MNDSPLLNRELLPHNTCFGCGLDNPAGLHIEIRRDPAEGALSGRFVPTSRMDGFPGITHGGLVYTALDCFSTWVATLLGPNREAGWILRSATTTYHRPAPVGRPLTLVGRIREQAGPWDPLVVHTEARLEDGVVCVEADFKVVPLTQEKLAAVGGLREIPDNWKFFLSGGE